MSNLSPRQRRNAYGPNTGKTTIMDESGNVLDDDDEQDWPDADNPAASVWENIEGQFAPLPAGRNCAIKFSQLYSWNEDLPGEDFYMPEFDPSYWGEAGARSIVDWEEVKHYRPRMEQAYHACLAIRNGESHMSYGKPGTGKTEFYRWLSARLGWPLFVKEMTPGMEEGDFFGTWTSSDGNLKFKESFLPQAMRLGALTVLDEVSAGPSDYIVGLNGPAGGGPLTLTGGGADSLAEAVIEPAETFRLICLDNHNGEGDDTGQFVGTNVLNAAFRDRLTTLIEFKYLDCEDEVEVLRSILPNLPTELAEYMVGTANIVRQAYDDGSLSMTMSMRTLRVWGAKMLILRDAQKALDVTFTSKFASEEMREIVRMAVDCTFGTNVN